MKAAKTRYRSPLQTEQPALRELLKKCEPYGLELVRSIDRDKNYKVVCGSEELTDFVTPIKLGYWLDGYGTGAERTYTSNISALDFAIKDAQGLRRFDSAIEAYENVCQKYGLSMTKLDEAQRAEAVELFNKIITNKK